MAICENCGAEFNEGAGWSSHTCPTPEPVVEETSEPTEETKKNGDGDGG